MNTKRGSCDCVLCKNNHEFAIDDELMHELLGGNVTIFAGAGISTETRNVLKNWYSHHCKITGVIKAYLKLQKEKLKRGAYEDVAYIEGYINGLTYLLMTNEERDSAPVPMYFVFGAKEEISDVAGFIDRLRDNPAIHKAAHKRALVYLNSLSDPESAEFHHPPWL